MLLTCVCAGVLCDHFDKCSVHTSGRVNPALAASPSQVTGTHKTVQGGEVTVTGAGNSIKVNDAIFKRPEA